MRAFFFGVGVVWFAYRVYNGSGNNTTLLESLDVLATRTGANIMGTPASKMKVSLDGLNRIAAREGFSATRYADATGFSIGYGHFIKAGDFFSEPISLEKGAELLREDADKAADAVRAYVTVALTQNQFDALTSFVYNIGAGAFKTSTALKRVNAGDFSGAAVAMGWFNKATIDGAFGVYQPLVARRADEVQQFLA